MVTMIGRRRRVGAFAVIDLPERHERSYFACLEDWSDEMAEAGEHKAAWYARHRDAGLGVKVAVDDRDRPLGMIQYVPIEHSPAEGDRLYVILCIWIHGHRQGVGDVQGQGIGTALLEAAEADARDRGAVGMVAWGLRLPVWMRSSWFKRHGYRTADRLGARELVWKPFTDDARPPVWIRPTSGPAPRIGRSDQVEVTAFHNGWCPAANLVYERAKRAAGELGEQVRFVTIDTDDRSVVRAHGRFEEVLVDGRPLQRGAPPSYRSVRRRLARRRRALQRSRV